MKTLVKVLIWIGAFIISFIAEIIVDAIFQKLFPGFRMGWVLRLAFVGLMFLIGRKLSERWELRCRKIDVAVIDGKATAEGKSRREYLIEHTPKFIIDFCEDNHTKDAIEDLLKPYVKSGTITSKMAKALVEEFGIK